MSSVSEWQLQVPWVAGLPPNWRVCRFKAICRLSEATNVDHDCRLLSLSTTKGIVPKTYDSESQVRTGEDLERYWVVRPDHLVINPMWLAHGSVAHAQIEGVISPDYRVYDVGDRVSPAYLHHLLKSLEYLSLYGLFVRGETTYDRRVSKQDFNDIPVIIPPSEVQRRIAAFLDRKTAAIDEFIKKKERLVELLQEKRQAIITQVVTRGLDPSVPMRDSGVDWLDTIPAHWKVQRLRHLIARQVAGPYGSSLTKAMYSSSGVRVYGQQQVIPNDFSVGDYFISPEKFAEMGQYEVHPGNLLITVMGTIGRVAIVPPGVERGIINPRLVLYVVRQERMSPEFAAWACRSDLGSSQLAAMAKGTTMEGLNLRLLGDLWLPVPPRPEQDVLVLEIERIDEQNRRVVAAIARQIEYLREYRQALISAAVTGQFDVSKVAA